MHSFPLAKLVWASFLLGIQFIVNPTFDLFYFVCFGIVLDFLTGIIKSKVKKIPITSEGFRQTLVKTTQYITPIMVLFAASRYVPEYQNRLMMCCGFTMTFVIYVEVTSIFENLYDIDSTSQISNFFFKPILSILKFGIKNNPLMKAEDNLENKNSSQTKTD